MNTMATQLISVIRLTTEFNSSKYRSYPMQFHTGHTRVKGRELNHVFLTNNECY